MPKKPGITPSDVAAMLKWDIGDVIEFCADTLEDANEHGMAAVLRCVNYGNFELAERYLELVKDQDAAGEQTPELRERSKELSELLEQYLEETGDQD